MSVCRCLRAVFTVTVTERDWQERQHECTLESGFADGGKIRRDRVARGGRRHGSLVWWGWEAGVHSLGSRVALVTNVGLRDADGCGPVLSVATICVVHELLDLRGQLKESADLQRLCARPRTTSRPND